MADGMRISDWSSDVCSSDLGNRQKPLFSGPAACAAGPGRAAAGWGTFRGGHGQSFKPASKFLVGSAAGPEAPVLSMAGASSFVARPVAAGTTGPAAAQKREPGPTGPPSPSLDQLHVVDLSIYLV